MKTCETCSHWERWNKDEYEFKVGMGECMMVVLWWDASEWDGDKNGYNRIISPKYKDQKAFTQDGSDYSAALYTRKDFGCVEHKEKNACPAPNQK
jgi:hypothetical protein